MKMQPWALILCTLIAGCGSDPTPPPGQGTSDRFENLQSNEHTYPIPARELLQKVKAVVQAPPISIPVVKESEDTLLTDYKEYPGDWHILRRWQDRTRYKITVSPAVDNPDHSTIHIVEHTQQRSNPRDNWHNESDLDRTDRVQDFLRQIDQQLNLNDHK